MITIQPATWSNMLWVADHMRGEDRREVETVTGRSPADVLWRTYTVGGSACFAIFYTNGERCDEYPLAVFGVAPDRSNPDMGVVWLLATDDIRKAWLAIRQVAPSWLDTLSAGYPAGLHNIVDARNFIHLRWLKLTGFVSKDTITVNGHLFIHAVREKTNNV